MSQLGITYAYLRERLGEHRGYRSDPDAWNAHQTEKVKFCIQDGLRILYTGAAYEWSYLKPWTVLTLPDAASELLLPADFGFPVGEMYFDDDVISKVLKLEGDAKVVWRRQMFPDNTGQPEFAAITPAASTKIQQQRQKLIFWPTSDEAYPVRCRYSINPQELGEDNPYPPGGPAHANAILEACLMASERADGVIGVHHQLYQEALAMSKEHDRKVKPQTLGYSDRSRRASKWGNGNVVTYTGYDTE